LARTGERQHWYRLRNESRALGSFMVQAYSWVLGPTITGKAREVGEFC
jgi:hypothetical protein